jgi:hypothetical protein
MHLHIHKHTHAMADSALVKIRPAPHSTDARHPIKGHRPKSQYFSQNATRNNVAIGPKSSEMRNQLRPLLFFPWAIPALINARLPHPGRIVRSGAHRSAFHCSEFNRFICIILSILL